jgi:predicted NBD/HSP70 family sugar kinase
MAARRAAHGQRSETVRRDNLAAIVRTLHLEGPRTRSALGERTGLSRSAIGRLVGELAALGLVVEEPGDSAGAPGRPSPVVALVADRGVALALELAVDSLAVAVVGLGGRVVERIRVHRTRRPASVDELVDEIVSLAEVMADRWRTRALVGVGVAVVGVVRRGDGFVSTAPNLGWRDVALGDALRAALDVAVHVVVANEADLGALAEHRRGAAVGVDDVLFLSGEVGVGGGVITGGHPLTGVAGLGGEVGHLPVNPTGGVACRCGATGCWETEVGEEALLVRAGRRPDGGDRAVESVLDDAEAGDPGALAAIDLVAEWLGIGLAGLVNVLNPSCVVLGGRYARLHPFVAARIDAELDRRALAAPRAAVEVVPAALGVDAPLLGAAELALEPILIDPAAWISRAGTLVEPTIARRTSRRMRRDATHIVNEQQGVGLP